MRARPRSVARPFFALLALLALGAPLHAQEGAAWRGTFRRDADASDSMKKIVDAGMARLGSIYRVWPISSEAKRRLQDTNRPYEHIEFLPEGSSLTTVTDFYRLTTPMNGKLERWERKKGDFIDVTTRTEGSRLEQVFDASDGRRVNVYTLSPDGATLTLDVTVTSPKLSSPLTYRQVYRRAG
jgi:hypothetical protein